MFGRYTSAFIDKVKAEYDLKELSPCVHEQADAAVMNLALNHFFNPLSLLNFLFQIVLSWLWPNSVFNGIALDSACIFQQSEET